MTCAPIVNIPSPVPAVVHDWLGVIRQPVVPDCHVEAGLFHACAVVGAGSGEGDPTVAVFGLCPAGGVVFPAMPGA